MTELTIHQDSGERRLTAFEFQALAAVPVVTDWFFNIDKINLLS